MHPDVPGVTHALDCLEHASWLNSLGVFQMFQMFQALPSYISRGRARSARIRRCARSHAYISRAPVTSGTSGTRSKKSVGCNVPWSRLGLERLERARFRGRKSGPATVATSIDRLSVVIEAKCQGWSENDRGSSRRLSKCGYGEPPCFRGCANPQMASQVGVSRGSAALVKIASAREWGGIVS